MRNYIKILGFLVFLAVSFSLLGLIGEHAIKAEAKKEKLPKEKTLPVAEIKKKIITVKELEDKINSQNPFLRKRYAEPKEKQKFLKGMVDFEVLALEAKALGYDKNPKVKEAEKRAMVQRQMEVILEQRASKESITKKEIEDYYNKHIVEFKRPERRRVAVIVTATKKEAEKIKKEAEKVKNNLRKFQELVRKYSIDNYTKKRGGLLGYFPKDTKSYQKTLVDATYSIKNTGDLMGPVKVKLDKNNRIARPGKGEKDGWIIIRLSGISPKVEKSLEQAEPLIRERLWRKKQSTVARSYIKELLEKYKDQIKIFEDKLDLVRIDTSFRRANPFGKKFHSPSNAKIKMLKPKVGNKTEIKKH